MLCYKILCEDMSWITSLAGGSNVTLLYDQRDCQLDDVLMLISSSYSEGS